MTELLGELDFQMDNSMLLTLRNSIFSFLAENVRGNMQIDVTEFQPEDGEILEFPHQDTNNYWDDYR